MIDPYFQSLENANQGEKFDLSEVIAHINFNEQGLIPVIAQQHDTGEVLMMAWMNKDSMLETLETQRVCYWSRSRKQLWRKGETSGHQQVLVDMRLDCDGDAVLCLVDQTGAACHTNRKSCFYLSVDGQHVMINSNIEH